MKRKYLKLSALILSVSALTVLSSCETSARYIGSNTWEGEVKEGSEGEQKEPEPDEHDGWFALNNSNYNDFYNLTSNYNHFYLEEDITNSTSWYINSYTTEITLCLHGHTLNANNDSSPVIFSYYGDTFTIEDCVGTGKITGAAASVLDCNYGTIILNGGTIEGNTYSNGSGAAVKLEGGGTDAAFIMNGGSITGNSATYNGGAIYSNGGKVTINGGTISGNSAEKGGAIYVDSNSTLTINGGTISGNSATSEGGAIYSEADLHISGGNIENNTSLYDGGGVIFEHWNGNTQTSVNLYLSGNTTIYNNKNTSGYENNVKINAHSLITLEGELGDNSKIGVTITDESSQITTAETSTTYYNNAVSHFYSDNGQGDISIIGNYIGITLNGGSVEEPSPVTLTINFTYSSGTSYSLPSGQDVYIAGDWDGWTTPILTTTIDSNTVSITFSSLDNNTSIKYSVYLVPTGTSVTMADISGYWLADGYFSYNGTENEITSTVVIDDSSSQEEPSGDPTYILTFSIYYENQLQSVPEYASLYYTGDTNDWGYDEVIDNHDGTYSVYIYKTLNDGYWYNYGLIMNHTGNETELSAWTYKAFDSDNSQNPINQWSDDKNLYFAYNSSQTGENITIYSADYLANIIPDPALSVNLYLDITFSSTAGSLASGTDLLINGNMTGWISPGSQYNDDMVLVWQSGYTYRYTLNGAYKGERYEFKCSIGYQTNKIFSWANEITSSNGYTTLGGNWYVDIPEDASDGDVITPSETTYSVQQSFATIAPAIPSSGNPTYVLMGDFSGDTWNTTPSSDNLKLYCSTSSASMYWERDIILNGTNGNRGFRVSTYGTWSSTVNYSHFDTSSPVECTNGGGSDQNIIVPSSSTTYHVIIDMTCTAHSSYYIYVSVA